MGINRVFRDVYRIGMGYVSAYLIAQAEVAVIDTGLPKHREIILRAVSEAGRKPDEVKHILLTHHHADHTGSLAELMGATSGKAASPPDSRKRTGRGAQTLEEGFEKALFQFHEASSQGHRRGPRAREVYVDSDDDVAWTTRQHVDAIG